MNNYITHKFYVSGMHCKSCAFSIEKKISELSYVSGVKINFDNNTIEVTGDFVGVPKEELAKDFSTMFGDRRYFFSIEEIKDKHSESKLGDYKIAVPIAFLVVAIFFSLQSFGLIRLVDTSEMSFGVALLIGLVASLSSCAAVVGGIVLSMSAVFAREGDRIRPQILFHIGRLISFFMFGGAIGILGKAFTLNQFTSSAIGIIIAIVMILLGLHLLGIKFVRKFQSSLPKSFSGHISSISKINHIFTPFLVGVVTFFLPCGFTQSMQVYTLSSGSFLEGAMTMLVFALGTLPALAFVSFSPSIFDGEKSKIFFKVAGLLVIVFAIFNLINSLVIVGILPPVFHV